MNNTDCGACNRLKKYASGEENYRAVYESEYSIALYPYDSPLETHIVIMTKKHIPTLLDLSDDEIALDVMKAIQVAAKEIIASKGACKLEMWLGDWQNTKHFHCHVKYDPSM